MGLSICRSIVQAHGSRVWATANETPGRPSVSLFAACDCVGVSEPGEPFSQPLRTRAPRLTDGGKRLLPVKGLFKVRRSRLEGIATEPQDAQ